MKKSDTLQAIAESHGGVLKTSDAVQSGISRPYFLEFIKKYGYVKAGHGIYVSPDYWEDSLYILQLRFPGTVYSYETALYLLGLSDREPIRYEVTVKRGYNTKNLKAAELETYSVTQEYFLLGSTTAKTPFGNTVNVYGAERTICDILTSRSKIEIQDRQTALKLYVKSADKDIPKLMEYAKVFKVEKTIKQYMEVLL